MLAKLIFEDKTEFIGESFGADVPASGEVVFSTGMMGYPESLTDPSYKGQILILTYPLIGNYGIPDKIFWESDTIMVSGLIVSNYIDTPSHFQSKETLAHWFKEANLPLIEIKDTRFLTQKIREKGSMLGKIIFNKDIPAYDPNKENLVAKVSIKKPTVKGTGKKTVVLIDCGTKRNIEKNLLKRGIKVMTIPWDYDPFDTTQNQEQTTIDGLIISNGPGDPKTVTRTITTIQKSLDHKIPTLGICLGHQLVTLAAGGDTKKLKFGHRSQNQPCIRIDDNRCFITTQNHGFAVSKIPKGFKPWFINANDETNEGIIHERLPYMSVQFHPEATPGPTDTEWIFDYFLERINKK